jgi:hypothetical protein
MKMKSLLLVGVMMVMSTGCLDKSSSKSTLASAYDAIQNDRLEDFRKTLSPEMLQKYGTEEALSVFRSQFSTYQSVTLSESRLVHAVQGNQGFGHYGDILRVYEQSILGVQPDGKREILYTATVNCTVEVRRTHERNCDAGANGHSHCSNFVIDSEYRQCLISDLK